MQVVVLTDYPGQSPGVVEKQVTYPLETQLIHVPNVTAVRGQSMFEYSLVTVVFKAGTNLYWRGIRCCRIWITPNRCCPPVLSRNWGRMPLERGGRINIFSTPVGTVEIIPTESGMIPHKPINGMRIGPMLRLIAGRLWSWCGHLINPENLRFPVSRWSPAI